VCTITYDDFAQLATTKTCHYCWAPIHWAEVHKVNASWGYNLDRKDSNKGYTNDNCVVCCGRCNRGKCALFTYDEWRAMTAVFRNGELSNGIEIDGTESSNGGGDSTTDSSIGGVIGEAQNIGGVSEGGDPSIGSESPLDGSEAEGFGTGVSAVRQGLGDEAQPDPDGQ